MKFTKKHLMILILTVLFVFSAVYLVSCGEKAADDKKSETPAKEQDKDGGDGDGGETATEPEAPVETYEFPELDGGGVDFKFYNVPVDIWFYYTSIVFDDPPDDILDDAIYKRNRLIEDKFNINIREINMPGNDMWNYNPDIKKIVQSGSDEYDAIFVPASFNGTVGAMTTEGLFYNLAQVPTINLDGDWWNQTMLKEAAIGTGEKIFYTGSGINLFTLQAVSCVYFNQDMVSSLGMDLPYTKVKEGKWTFDLFWDYIKTGTNLNGAADFKWDQSGSATYGLVGYEDSSTALLAGSGEMFIRSGADGTPEIAMGSERFINVLTKIAEILNEQNGNYLYANNNDNVFHYEPIFRNGRGLMTIGELKAANVFREMDATFGILPIPKYEESQEIYSSHLINQAPVLVIPVTVPEDRVDFTGAVLDAMAYVSDRDVTPILFNVSVSQKQLRNEDSIEMLQLIKNSGSVEIGKVYGWTNDIYDSIRTKIGEGKSMDIVSEIEKTTDKMNAAIKKTMDAFDD